MRGLPAFHAGRDCVLFLVARKEPKELFKGTPLEKPRAVGKNPMIFTELNRNKKLTDKNPQIFVGEEQPREKAQIFRTGKSEHKARVATKHKGELATT